MTAIVREPRKLIIQIPCFNEQDCLAITLQALPRCVAGFDSLEILVVDDGSSDSTQDVARMHGAHHILELENHLGLGAAFAAGIAKCIQLGASVIVNIDADNQYCADDIEILTTPILSGDYRVTVGERPISTIPWFSTTKRWLHYLGNWFIRRLSGIPVFDSTSGFRAIRADLAAQLQLKSKYSYTVEMILHLSKLGEPIGLIPVRVNKEVLRPSRLIRNNAHYLWNTFKIIARQLTHSPTSDIPITGNYYNKYASTNPIERRLVQGFLDTFNELVRRTGARNIFEVGVGEGTLSMRLLEMGFHVRGCDIGKEVIEIANTQAESQGFGHPFFVSSVYELKAKQSQTELIIACEVLEHLDRPEEALNVICQLTTHWALFSVPREPLWRMLNLARFKYIWRLGNTPGHLQCWTSHSFKRIVERYFEIVEVRTPLPWTFVLCRAKAPMILKPVAIDSRTE